MPDEITLGNGVVEIGIARAYGPRIMRFGLAGRPSVFADAPDATRETPHGVWRAYGGHRLWAAPESFPFTYTIDGDPPTIEADGTHAVVRRAPGGQAPIGVEIELALAAGTSEVQVTHRLRNEGGDDLTIAPWGITVVRPGGTAVVPNPEWRPQRTALRPARPIVMWHYTALDDERLAFGHDAVSVRCDPAQPSPLKIGFGNERGWFAYVWERMAFVVRSVHESGAAYPDFGCSTEIYTEGAFCEVETLGPLVCLAPGGTAQHRETWSLIDDVDATSLVGRLSAASL